VSLDHVMVSRTEGGGAGQAAALLAALRGGAEFRTLGQRFWLGPSLALLSEAELGRVLGDAFAREVFALPGNDWSGPLESIRGLHLVRVTSRRPPLQRPFEEVSGQVREDWLEVLELESLRRKVTEISRRYRIEGPEAGAAAR
jgi:hypothetical protein